MSLFKNIRLRAAMHISLMSLFHMHPHASSSLTSLLILAECISSLVMPGGVNVNRIPPLGRRDEISSSTSHCRRVRRAMCPPLLAASSRPESDGRRDGRRVLPDVERVFALSDLHTDHVLNRSWLEERCRLVGGDDGDGDDAAPTERDALIVAGDVSHELSTLRETLQMLRENLNCQIFFVPGNHEAWIGGREMDDAGISDSMVKLDAVESLCRECGVHTDHHLVGTNFDSPTWMVPIRSWYDGSLMLPGCEDLCEDFSNWPWVDFRRCEWPSPYEPSDSTLGKIPDGLTEFFLRQNEGSIAEVSDYIEQQHGSTSPEKNCVGVITYSHFLPCQQTLPDWKDLEADTFVRDEWLDHPAPGTSAKFALVAGSELIDRQLRSIPSLPRENGKQMHVFGHSHRPKDFVLDDVRYVHNPLGSPRERESCMVPKDVDFKLIWDTRSDGGAVRSEQILRYWDEQIGGREAVMKYLNRRHEERRKVLKGVGRGAKRNKGSD